MNHISLARLDIVRELHGGIGTYVKFRGFTPACIAAHVQINNFGLKVRHISPGNVHVHGCKGEMKMNE